VSSLGDAAPAAQHLAQADHLPFPVVWDGHQAVAWQYDVSATPTSMFIDAQGRLRGQYDGELDAGLVRNGLAQAGAIACSRCVPVEPPAVGAGASNTAAGSGLRVTHVFSPPVAAAPFALPDQRGRLITPASLRGKVVALTFLSAVCTEQCPLVGQTLSQARRLLGPGAAHLSIVAISVAAEQDSPQATRRFAQKAGWIGTDWHYLTAPRSVLESVWNAYWVPVYAPPPIFKATGAGLVHQAGLYLIDPRGHLRAYDDVPFLASDVASSVRALLGYK
jgi:protein SCO1/2